MPAAIDNPFISHVEQKKEGVKFLRIDTDLNASFKEEVKEDDEEFKKSSEELTEVFKKALNNDKLDIKVEKMKNAGIASMITVSEETRRMQDMMKMYNMGGMDMACSAEWEKPWCLMPTILWLSMCLKIKKENILPPSVSSFTIWQVFPTEPFLLNE